MIWHNLLHQSSITILKTFIRRKLDFLMEDGVFDQAFNSLIINKIESFQCKATLAVTSAVGGTVREEFYQELGLVLLEKRR